MARVNLISSLQTPNGRIRTQGLAALGVLWSLSSTLREASDYRVVASDKS